MAPVSSSVALVSTMLAWQATIQKRLSANSSKTKLSPAAARQGGGRRQGSVSAWCEWAEQHLPTVWETSRGCALRFCQQSHRLFHETKNSHFSDWSWDFLGALFDGQDCNCVCGTVFLACAAEYVGLTAQQVEPMFGPHHVWIRIRDHEDRLWFLETTAPPGRTDWCVREETARDEPFYGCGTWHTQPDRHAILQEILINQILSSAEERRGLLLKSLYEGSQELMAQDEVPSLDLSYLLLRHRSSQEGRWCREQQRLVNGMLRSLRESRWPPECFLGSLLVLSKWVVFCRQRQPRRGGGLSLGGGGVTQDDDEDEASLHFEQLVRPILLQFFDIVQERLRQGLWSQNCTTLRPTWDQLRKTILYLKQSTES